MQVRVIGSYQRSKVTGAESRAILFKRGGRGP